MSGNLLSAPKARFVAAAGINGPAQPKPVPKHVEPPVAEPPAVTRPVSRKELWQQCEPIATLPRILDRFAVDLRLSGVVGEERTAKLVYLAVTSRWFSRPVSLAVKGPSSGGKSHTVQQVLKFFPADAYYDLTAMSERALAYSTEPVKHRFVVLYEAAGMRGQTART